MYIHKYMYMYKYICIYLHVHMHTQTNTRIHTRKNTHAHACIRTSTNKSSGSTSRMARRSLSPCSAGPARHWLISTCLLLRCALWNSPSSAPTTHPAGSTRHD